MRLCQTASHQGAKRSSRSSSRNHGNHQRIKTTKENLEISEQNISFDVISEYRILSIFQSQISFLANFNIYVKNATFPRSVNPSVPSKIGGLTFLIKSKILLVDFKTALSRNFHDDVEKVRRCQTTLIKFIKPSENDETRPL
jgi:hypothetical protein